MESTARRREPLSPQEREILLGYQRANYKRGLIFGLIGATIVYAMFVNNYAAPQPLELAIAGLLGFGLPLGAHIYLARLAARDLKDGYKQVIVGRLEQKRRAAPDTRAGQRTEGYYLTIGGEEIAVPPTLYTQVETGEMVNARFAPHTSYVFSAKDGQPAGVFTQYAETLAPLTTQETAHLQRIKLLYYALIAPVGLGGAVIAYWVLVDRPQWQRALVAVGFFAFTSFILSVFARAHGADLKTGQKRIITGRIEKKEKVQRRRGAIPEYYFTISGQVLAVEQEHYEHFHVGQVVEAHVPLNSQRVLGVALSPLDEGSANSSLSRKRAGDSSLSVP